MARTYSNVPVLSKIQLGNSTYYLKDADARAILDGIHADVYESLKLALGTVADGGNNLVTAGNIKAYVDEIAEIGFDVVKLATLPAADADAYETYHNKIVLVENAQAEAGSCVEYVIIRSGAGTEQEPYAYAWEQIGSTKVDLSGYVTDVKYLVGTHKLQQKKGDGTYEDVHTFGAMAEVSQAETTVDDYVKGVSSATVTAAGSINDITIIDSVGTLPSFTYGAFTANKPTTLDLTKFNGGSKKADTFNAGTLPTKAADQWDAGALPSKAADTFTAGSFTEGKFTAASLVTETKALYKQGIKAEVGESGTANAETLIFTNVDKEADIKVVSSFDGGSKLPDTFSAPTFTEGAFDAGSLPTFTEGTFDAGDLPSFKEGAFTPAALNDGFYSAGTAASKVDDTFDAGSLPTTKVQSMTFTGSEVNASVVLTKGNKTITVDPKAA